MTALSSVRCSVLLHLASFYREFGVRSFFRLFAWAFVVVVMFVYSRGNFLFAKECVTQPGLYIDIQRQIQEIRAAGEESCD